jgi:hypothetical protein
MSSDRPNAHEPIQPPSPLIERREFIRSPTRADMLKMGLNEPVGVIKSGPFKGRVYQRTPNGGIVRVK